MRRWKGELSGRPKDKPFYVHPGPPLLSKSLVPARGINWIISGPYYYHHVAYARTRKMADRIAALLNAARTGGRFANFAQQRHAAGAKATLPPDSAVCECCLRSTADECFGCQHGSKFLAATSA